jgi:hypothetical protein
LPQYLPTEATQPWSQWGRNTNARSHLGSRDEASRDKRMAFDEQPSLLFAACRLRMPLAHPSGLLAIGPSLLPVHRSIFAAGCSSRLAATFLATDFLVDNN